MTTLKLFHDLFAYLRHTKNSGMTSLLINVMKRHECHVHLPGGVSHAI